MISVQCHQLHLQCRQQLLRSILCANFLQKDSNSIFFLCHAEGVSRRRGSTLNLLHIARGLFDGESLALLPIHRQGSIFIIRFVSIFQFIVIIRTAPSSDRAVPHFFQEIFIFYTVHLFGSFIAFYTVYLFGSFIAFVLVMFYLKIITVYRTRCRSPSGKMLAIFMALQ